VDIALRQRSHAQARECSRQQEDQWRSQGLTPTCGPLGQVHIIQAHPRVARAVEVNHRSALSAALLMLPRRFDQPELFNMICGLSYLGAAHSFARRTDDARRTGDIRMGLAEHPRKVRNIVKHQTDKLREIYTQHITELSTLGHLREVDGFIEQVALRRRCAQGAAVLKRPCASERRARKRALAGWAAARALPRGSGQPAPQPDRACTAPADSANGGLVIAHANTQRVLHRWADKVNLLFDREAKKSMEVTGTTLRGLKPRSFSRRGQRSEASSQQT
jgi:hypothetical protein